MNKQQQTELMISTLDAVYDSFPKGLHGFADGLEFLVSCSVSYFNSHVLPLLPADKREEAALASLESIKKMVDDHRGPTLAYARSLNAI